MQMNGNTILITGGATGIGYAFAKYFQKRGNTVIICGRRENRLAQAAEEIKGIHTFKCDVTNKEERVALFNHIKENFPDTNILINNAGVMRDLDLTKGVAELDKGGGNEIRTDLEAPIYLSALFTPFLSGKKNAAIINISSVAAFLLEYSFAARAPLYCAAKAGLHAFSVVQRVQLAPLGIKVIEIVPPGVNSEISPRNMEKSPSRLTADDFVEKAMSEMERGAEEINMINISRSQVALQQQTAK